MVNNDNQTLILRRVINLAVLLDGLHAVSCGTVNKTPHFGAFLIGTSQFHARDGGLGLLASCR